jgi:hypothetical protein
MRRREFLRSGGLAIVHGIGACLAGSPAFGLEGSVASLENLLDRRDGIIVRRGSGTSYDRLTRFYNRRLESVLPEAVVYCRTPEAIAKAVRWCSEHEILVRLSSIAPIRVCWKAAACSPSRPPG